MHGRDYHMKIKIRGSKINDAPSIAKIHVESWNTIYKNIVPDEYLRSRHMKYKKNTG